MEYQAMKGVENFIGLGISLPAWKVDGIIIDQRAAAIGPEDQIEFLVEAKPDEPMPRWYRIAIDEDGNLSNCEVY